MFTQVNDNWTEKMLNIKHFWGHFSIKHCPPQNSLTIYPLMGLKNYDISLLLKKSQSNLPICLENTAVGT